jgi:hypothetical protein
VIGVRAEGQRRLVRITCYAVDDVKLRVWLVLLGVGHDRAVPASRQRQPAPAAIVRVCRANGRFAGVRE